MVVDLMPAPIADVSCAGCCTLSPGLSTMKKPGELLFMWCCRSRLHGIEVAWVVIRCLCPSQMCRLPVCHVVARAVENEKKGIPGVSEGLSWWWKGDVVVDLACVLVRMGGAGSSPGLSPEYLRTKKKPNKL